MKKYKIYDKTDKKYCKEVALGILGCKGYSRDVFTEKQAKEYIECHNDLRKSMKKEPHQYVLEEVK